MLRAPWNLLLFFSSSSPLSVTLTLSRNLGPNHIFRILVVPHLHKCSKDGQKKRESDTNDRKTQNRKKFRQKWTPQTGTFLYAYTASWYIPLLFIFRYHP
ncbi:hypothetical protein BDZ91DRAFT_724551 [Kalaharituber pfeilii]|nr:hypothetical protein BDZ91DRAFT_724551 [Kalaharituber pfeilii]